MNVTPVFSVNNNKVVCVPPKITNKKIIYCFCRFSNQNDEWKTFCKNIINNNKSQSDKCMYFFHCLRGKPTIETIKVSLGLDNVVVEPFTSGSQGEPLWGKITEIKKICQKGTITIGQEKRFNDLFDKIWFQYDKEDKLKKVHSLFLPLDIDMQALEILAKKKENGKKVKDPKEYLKEMYADNIDYVQKLNKLRAKVNTIGEIEGIDKERFEKLAGISNENVDQFFEKLGGKKNDPDEFLGHFWGINGVNSFHDWYCALSTCLREAEGCEGK